MSNFMLAFFRAISGFIVFFFLRIDAFSIEIIDHFECKGMSISSCISRFEETTGYRLIVLQPLGVEFVDVSPTSAGGVGVVEDMFRSAGFDNIGVVVDEDKMTIEVTLFERDVQFSGKINQKANGDVPVGSFSLREAPALNRDNANVLRNYDDVGRDAKIDLDGYVKLPSGQIMTFREMESVQQKSALRLNQDEVIIVKNNGNNDGITLRQIVETAQRANDLIEK